MQRQVEPELMDELEQAKAYAQANFSTPHQNFVDLLKLKMNTIKGLVVDLGCGPGDIAIRCARNFVGTRIIGIDGAEPMLRLAQDAINRHGLAGLIQLRQHVLPCPLGLTADAIISNSLLHHLHEPNVLWQTIKALAKPQCKIFIMDLMRPESSQQAKDLVQTYAANEADVLQHDFYHSLLAAFRPAEIRQQLQEFDLTLKIEPVSDRHLIIYGTLR